MTLHFLIIILSNKMIVLKKTEGLISKGQSQVIQCILTTGKTSRAVKWSGKSIVNVTQHFWFTVFSRQTLVTMRKIGEAAVLIFFLLFLGSFVLRFVNSVQIS
jgi:hypothetical protein